MSHPANEPAPERAAAAPSAVTVAAPSAALLLLALGLGLSARATPAAAQSPAPPLLAGATQLLVVTTPDWDATAGELRRYVRDGAASPWRPDGGSIPIVVGRTGLAWGVGFDALAEGSEPHKREGDGKSPAGVFPLGTAFGFAPPDSAQWVKLPWLQLTATTECVDDTASAQYTNVLDRSAVPRVDWASSERMRSIGVYRLGAVIAYNETPPVNGRGSCVFLHIWGGPDSHTAGCTAMDAGELERLLGWLDPEADPVVVQVPAHAYARLRGVWGLPERN